MNQLFTVIIGSKQWCKQWEAFYWKVALKYADRAVKYPDNEFYTNMAMFHMFNSYDWQNRKPWA